MPNPFQERSDDALVRLAQAEPDSDASREAAAYLLNRHARRVYLWCRRYARSEDEARDLAQDVLAHAYGRLHLFNGRSQFTSWLFALTRHCCLSHARRFNPVRDADLDPDTLPSTGKNPEQLLIEKSGEEALRRLIAATLDATEQDAIWLRCVDQMSVDDITEVLGLQNATGARGLLQRARRRLRAALEAGDGEMEEPRHG